MNERLARLEEKYKASETALTTTKMELDRRLAEMNQFREQISDERHGFLTREMYDREHHALEDRVSELEKSRASALGTVVGYSGIIGIALALLAIFWHH